MLKFKLLNSVSLLVLLMLASYFQFASTERAAFGSLQNATANFPLTSNKSQSADLPSLDISSSSVSTGSEVFMLIVQNEYNEEAKKDGWLVIANKVTKVLLIGNQYLNGNDRVGFSKYQTKTGNDTTCVPWTQTFEIDIIESSSLLNLTYARTFISMPASYEESWFDIFGSAKIDVYYLCLVSQNTARYPTKLFQGSKLLIFQEPLPTWMKVGFCLIGFLFSFYLSGLVLGIMAIDITDLLLLIKAGTPTQKSHAKHLLPIRKDGNRILSTLLLSNVAANSLVTVFLNNLIDSGFQTFILSTFSLCLIGEIIPQAVFNRHGFILASKSLFFIKFLLFATAPFAVPIGMILDRFLGTEAGMAYTRKQMRQLIELQYENGNLKIHETEMHILQSALTMQKTQVESIMVKISKVFMINFNDHLDYNHISSIMSSGFTRIPVFKNDRSNIVGIINVKDLAVINPEDNMSLDAFRSCYKMDILCVPQDLSIIKLLQEFLKGKSHLAFVYRRVKKLDPINEIDECSDREASPTKQDEVVSDRKTTTKRKRTTSNLSASLNFLCTGGSNKKTVDLDEHIIESTSLVKRKSEVDDTGIFLVTGDEELPDVYKAAMQHIIGIITLEDIFELILQEKIFDEKDLDPTTLKNSHRDFTNPYSIQEIPIYEKTLYAASQFLSNLIPFTAKYISESCLLTLLRNNFHSFTPTGDNIELELHKQNVRANYFILILSGTGNVMIGKENHKFLAQTFSYFGEQAILSETEIKRDNINTEPMKDIKFIPDYTLTLREKCMYIKITRQSYVSAIKLVKIKKSLDTMSLACETNVRPKFMTHIKKNSNSADLKNKLANVKPCMLQQVHNHVVDTKDATFASKSAASEKINETMVDDEVTQAYLLSNKV